MGGRCRLSLTALVNITQIAREIPGKRNQDEDVCLKILKWNLKRKWTQFFQEPFLTSLDTEVLWTAGLWCSFFEFIRMRSLVLFRSDFVIATPSEIWRSSLFWKVATLEYWKLSGSPTFSWWKIARCLAIPFLLFLFLMSASCSESLCTALNPDSPWYSARMFLVLQILQVM